MKKKDSKLAFKTKPLFVFKRTSFFGGNETDPTATTITMTVPTTLSPGFNK